MLSIILITRLIDDVPITTAYDEAKMPREILLRLKELPHEPDWATLCFGDVKGIPSEYLERKETLQSSVVAEGIDLREPFPFNWLVKDTRDFLHKPNTQKIRVVRVRIVASYTFGRLQEVYYVESELPMPVLEAFRQANYRYSYKLLYEDVKNDVVGLAHRIQQLQVAQLGHGIALDICFVV